MCEILAFAFCAGFSFLFCEGQKPAQTNETHTQPAKLCTACSERAEAQTRADTALIILGLVGHKERSDTAQSQDEEGADGRDRTNHNIRRRLISESTTIEYSSHRSWYWSIFQFPASTTPPPLSLRPSSTRPLLYYLRESEIASFELYYFIITTPRYRYVHLSSSHYIFIKYRHHASSSSTVYATICPLGNI